jgi:hypothetical protein
VFNSQEGQEIFLFPTALRLTQPPVQWVMGTLFPQVKQPGHYESRLKICGAIFPLPHMSSCCKAYLINLRDNFIFEEFYLLGFYAM